MKFKKFLTLLLSLHDSKTIIVPRGMWERWVWKRYSRCKIPIVLAGNTTKGIYSLWFSKPLSWKDTPDRRQAQSMRGEE